MTMMSEEASVGLPDGWEESSVGALTTLVYRYPTYYGINYVETGVPEVRGELLLDNGEIETDATKFRFISEDTARGFPKVRLEPGDIVMSVRGTMGKIGLVRDDIRGAVITANLIRLAPRRSVICPEFFRWALLAPRFVAALNAASPQTTIKTITAPGLKELALPLPRDISEQQKIAGVLGLVQRAIEQEERLLALTRELKKSLMQKLFTEGRRGERQKETEIGLVPESWQGVALGALACKPGGFLQTGPFGSQLHKDEYIEEGVGVVNPTHLLGNRINHDDVPKVSKETASRLDRHRLAPGDILFARRGEIGRHGMVTEAERGWLCGTGCFLVRVRQQQIDNRFLSYEFSTRGSVAWLNSHAAGAIMPNLNNQVLGTMPVFYPPFDEQVEIADALDAVEKKASLHERTAGNLASLFRTLLHQLMTAQIRVNELDLSEVEKLAA
jgi:type I restriction enzyme S subunit